MNPNDVAGYYWAAVNMGNYALGLGVVKALSSGLEEKFRDRLGRASALNDGYEWGGVETAWGRFFDKLPWPKRDRKQAEEHLRRALQINPSALRARLYLGILYLNSARARRRSACSTRSPPPRWPLRRARGAPGQGDGRRAAAGAGLEAQVSVVVAIAAGGCG